MIAPGWRVAAGMLLIVWYLSCGQQPSRTLQQEHLEAEAALVAAYDHMMAADPLSRYDRLTPAFKEKVILALEKDALFRYPFDSLGSRVSIISSSDDKLRIFSWDEKSGGSSHNYSAVAQYIGQEGDVISQSINNYRFTGEQEYTEAIYYEINSLTDQSNEIYFLFGRGTFGGGHQHYVIRALKYEDDRLVDCGGCFDGQNYWPIVLSRVDRVDLSFSITDGIIRHNHFKEDKETGFYQPTGKTVELRWEGGAFKKSIK